MAKSINFFATIAFRALESYQNDTSKVSNMRGGGGSLLPMMKRRQQQQRGGGGQGQLAESVHHRLDISTRKLSTKTLKTVKDMRLSYELETVDETLTYDIHKCPPEIPKGYPKQWSIIDVLARWNPDDMHIPQKIYQGFCELDWSKPEERTIAEMYREAELPFVIRNHSTVWEAAERWSNRHYLSSRLQNVSTRNEHSAGNQMPYWKPPRPGTFKDWIPPTENVELTFDEWVRENNLQTTRI
eukprot:scaffold2599_cov125-Cylindrotheca_fusiformis.AAC.15